MKRIVSIQDLSCIGKCSLGVALPVLSAMGLECAALPTALLSAHTAFDGFICRDMQEFFRPVAAHWRSYSLARSRFLTYVISLSAKIRRA